MKRQYSYVSEAKDLVWDFDAQYPYENFAFIKQIGTSWHSDGSLRLKLLVDNLELSKQLPTEFKDVPIDIFPVIQRIGH